MMTSVQEGQANQAFEANEDDNVVPDGPEKDTKKDTKKVTKKAFDPVDDIEDESSGCQFFGIFPLPEICSKYFLNAAWILIFLSWASTIQGMVINGLVNVVLSSLERRFGLESTETGVIAGCYDIGSMLSIIPISYYGGRIGTSKPKYISLGLIVMGIGSLMFTIPHFITDNYLQAFDQNNLSLSVGNQNDLCNIGGLVEVSTDADKEIALAMARSLANNKYLFIFGQILHGIGAAPLIALGTTLLDESVSRVSAPLYIGIFQTFFVVGPAIGYILGGYFLEIYTDFDQGPNPQMLNSDSPLWVGAWWFGFMISFASSISCAVFIGCFPAVIPRKNTDIEPANKVLNSQTSTPNKAYGKLKELPNAIWALLTNPTYMMINFGGGADGFCISGLSAFLPKFLQSQYGFSAGIAGAIVGALVIPAGGLGTFSGGYIAKRFRLNRSQVIKMYIYCQAITIPCCLGILFYCPSNNFAGVNIDINCDNTAESCSQKIILKDTVLHPEDLQMYSCNSDCTCDLTNFSPVCNSEDSVMYFNACFAGCLNKLSVDNKTEYKDCQCIPDGKIATPGSCDKKCTLMPGFLVLVFICIWFTFMSAMPNVVATLRAVEPIHRSLGLGIESIILRLMGTIPGPIFFGYIIDQVCLLKDGNCLFYDNYSMAVSMGVATVVVKILAVGFFGLAYYFSERSPIPDENVDLDVIH